MRNIWKLIEVDGISSTTNLQVEKLISMKLGYAKLTVSNQFELKTDCRH